MLFYELKFGYVQQQNKLNLLTKEEKYKHDKKERSTLRKRRRSPRATLSTMSNRGQQIYVYCSARCVLASFSLSEMFLLQLPLDEQQTLPLQITGTTSKDAHFTAAATEPRGSPNDQQRQRNHVCLTWTSSCCCAWDSSTTSSNPWTPEAAPRARRSDADNILSSTP